MSPTRVTIAGMDTFLYLIIGLVVGALVGWLLGSRGKGNSAVSEAFLKSEQERAARAEADLASLRETNRLQAEQDSRVMQQMAPIQLKLKEMQEKVIEIERERTDQFVEISTQLKNQQAIDAQLRNTTATLAGIMTSNQTRGGLGEITLEKLLQAAGLVKGVHYTTQFQTTNANEEDIKPDIIIRFPDDKTIVVDSKTPLAAYQAAVAERDRGAEFDKKREKSLLDQHVAAVKKHIVDLAKKEYSSGVKNSPEFVLMYIPWDPILANTIELDESLLDFAFKNRVALVSPVSFFSVLKTVEYTWRQSSSEVIVNELLDLGAEIYDELRKLGSNVGEMQIHLEKAVADFNKIVFNLDGKVLEKISDLNAKAGNRLGTKPIEPLKEIEKEPKRLKSTDFQDPKAIE